MSGDIAPYLGLVASEHASQPNFIASLSALLQPIADEIEVLDSMPGLYDLDAAVGAQLDTVGLWVGLSRYVEVPITGVYFSFDISGLGFDQGVWFGPYDAGVGVQRLDDATYRLALNVQIAADNWDGTIAGAYAALTPLLDPYGTTLTITGDVTLMTLAFGGTAPPPIIKALFTGQYISLRPAGVPQSGP